MLKCVYLILLISQPVDSIAQVFKDGVLWKHRGFLATKDGQWSLSLVQCCFCFPYDLVRVERKFFFSPFLLKENCIHSILAVYRVCFQVFLFIWFVKLGAEDRSLFQSSGPLGTATPLLWRKFTLILLPEKVPLVSSHKKHPCPTRRAGSPTLLPEKILLTNSQRKYS